MPRLALALVLLLLSFVGCGGNSDDAPAPSTAPGDAAGFGEAPPDADTEEIDPFDPAYSLLPESDEAEQRLIRRLGRREDFRVPRDEVADLPDGALARAVVARIWHEVDLTDGRYRTLTAGQRAFLALQWADYEILNGGFAQLWFNTAGIVAQDLPAAAARVGAREHAAIFADAVRLFPGGRVPRERGNRQRVAETLDEQAVAALDDRYAATQYRRRSLLAPVLAAYVRGNPREFFAD